jgi:hypothetical protein
VCSGTVFDAAGNGIANLVVEIVGQPYVTGNTNAQGAYKLAAPMSSPYVIQFREPRGNTRLLDVRQLAPGRDQSLFVTIPSAGTFSAEYSALQVVETICAQFLGAPDREAAAALIKQIPARELTSIVDQVVADLNSTALTDPQRHFLSAKAHTVRTQLLAWGGAPRAQCNNNLKAIALAIENYNRANKSFIPAAICDAHGKPLLSWRVLLLPNLGHNAVYKQFRTDEPWDSPHNLPLVDQMPTVYRCPSEVMPQGFTTYQVVVDPRSLFTGEPSGIPHDSVTDPLSKTLLVVEAVSAVPWSKPGGLSLASSDSMFGIGSKHPGGFYAAMADGSVRFFARSAISPELLKASVTRNGGEAVPPR